MKYRIIKHGERSYDVQKKTFLFGWITILPGPYTNSIEDAKEWITWHKSRRGEVVHTC